MLKGKPIYADTPADRPPKPENFSTTSTSHENGAFLRFLIGDGREFGFPFAQLLQFVLEPNSNSNSDSDPDAPQRLVLSFSSHDVTVTGCRLYLLCEHLDQHRAIRIKTEDLRFANFEREKAFVVDISIKPIVVG